MATNIPEVVSTAAAEFPVPGFDNLLHYDGIGISITGIAIVFSGLLGICLFIAALPKVLGLLRQLTQPKPVAEDPSAAGVVVEDGSDMDQILQAAIAFVMDAERERNMEGDVRVMNRPEPSSWALSDKMRTFPTRVN